VQGYNAQAAVSDEQIVLAAEISVDAPDFGHLEPMVEGDHRRVRRSASQSRPR
jgi:hypothetical protein